MVQFTKSDLETSHDDDVDDRCTIIFGQHSHMFPFKYSNVNVLMEN